MKKKWIITEEINVQILQKWPVWKYCEDDMLPENAVVPVEEIPVDDLAGKLIGTEVVLANGDICWAILSNISPNSARATKQFLCVWVENKGNWFELARYHDVDFEKRSPQQLSKFLGLKDKDVFPIKYDISNLVVGKKEILKSSIPLEPEEKLDEDELIELAME